MIFLIEQRRRIVLTMNIDQLDAQLMEDGHRHQRTVDPADILSVQVDLPLNDGLRVVLHPLLIKPVKVGNIPKNRPNRSLLRPGTDHIPIGPLPQDGGDGVNDDGFTCTGLTGEYIEALIEGDVSTLDHRNILYMKQVQHPGHSLLKTVGF